MNHQDPIDDDPWDRANCPHCRPFIEKCLAECNKAAGDYCDGIHEIIAEEKLSPPYDKFHEEMLNQKVTWKDEVRVWFKSLFDFLKKP